MAEVGAFDGLVIRAADYGESDKILTVLNAEFGQCTLIAKGARSSKSKFVSLCQPLCYVNFEFYKRNNLRWISGGEINSAFFMRNIDLEGYALASYIISLATEITGENIPCDDILKMTLNTLYAIENKKYGFAQIKAAYEIFAADAAGFSPDMSRCVHCGHELCDGGFWLDVMNGHISCADCKSKRSNSPVPHGEQEAVASIILPLDNASVSAWRYISGAPPKRIFSFSVKDAESLELLGRASEAYILNHLEKGFTTLDFYRGISEDIRRYKHNSEE